MIRSVEDSTRGRAWRLGHGDDAGKRMQLMGQNRQEFQPAVEVQTAAVEYMPSSCRRGIQAAPSTRLKVPIPMAPPIKTH